MLCIGNYLIDQKSLIFIVYSHLSSFYSLKKRFFFLLNFFHLRALKMYRIFFVVEKFKRTIYIIMWWREITKDMQEFKLTGTLSQKMAANNYNVILVLRKREEKNLLPAALVEPLQEEFRSLYHILRVLINLFEWWTPLQGHHGRFRVLLSSARSVKENFP